MALAIKMKEEQEAATKAVKSKQQRVE